MMKGKCEHTQEYMGDPNECDGPFDNLPDTIVKDDTVIGLRYRCTRCNQKYKRMFVKPESVRGIYWKSVFNPNSFLWEGDWEDIEHHFYPNPVPEEYQKAYDERRAKWWDRAMKVLTNTYWKKREYKGEKK